MPNADAYRGAASKFRHLATLLADQAALTAGWPLEQIGAGPAVEAIADHLRLAADRYLSAGDGLARLATVCDERAEVCDDFHRRLTDWLSPATRLVHPRPSSPFDWVD